MNRPESTKTNPSNSDVFLLDNDNRALLKGDQPFSPQKPKLWKPMLALVLSIFGLYLIAAVWSEYVLLNQTGVVTDAVVTGVSEEGTSRRGTNYYMTYEFTIDGQVYTEQERVDYLTYTELLFNEGTRIEITYAPSDPRISSAQPDMQPNGTTTVIIVFVLIFSGYTVIRSLRLRTRQGDLSRKGQLIRGQVLLWQATEVPEQYVEVDMTYTFNTPDGRPISADLHTRINYWNYKYATPPKIGTPLAILFVDDSTYEVL